jgi:hypothetical protein
MLIPETEAVWVELKKKRKRLKDGISRPRRSPIPSLSFGFEEGPRHPSDLVTEAPSFSMGGGAASMSMGTHRH